MSDTFLNGKVCNPVMPFSEHFETFNVLIDRCYSSRYLPLQGFILAIGKILGHEIIGNILVKSLAACIAYWALISCFSFRYALLGSIIFSLHASVIFDWDLSYWGGSIGTLSGFLLLGSIFRLINNNNIYKHSLLAGLAIGLFVISRPYEGLIFTVPALVFLLFRASKYSIRKKIEIASYITIIPCLFIILLGSYNYKITGKWYLSPYFKYAEEYGATPFLFSNATDNINYTSQEMANYFNNYDNKSFLRVKELSLESIVYVANKGARYIQFYFPLLTYLILLLLFTVRKSSEGKFLILQTGFFLLSVSVTIVPLLNHYSAPIFSSLLFLMIYCLQQFWRSKINLPLKKIATASFVMILLLGTIYDSKNLLRVKKGLLHDEFRLLIEDLKKTPEQYLLLISYKEPHNFLNEFVYNTANINDQQIIIARSLSEEKNSEFINYYKNRTLVKLEISNQISVTSRQ